MLLQEIVDKYENQGVDIFASEHYGYIILSRIIVPKELRNQGIGTAFMEELSDYANKTNQRIALTPDKVHGGYITKLREFYRRFGFLPNKGRNRDFKVRESFVRRPAFENFIHSLKTDENQVLLESILEGFNVLFEEEQLSLFTPNEIKDPTKYYYHETKKDHIRDIQNEGLIPTSYGQSFVNEDTHELMSPDDFSEEELENIPEEETKPRTYFSEDEQKSSVYGDGIFLRFPKNAITSIEVDVDYFTYDSIPPEDIEIKTNEGWRNILSVDLNEAILESITNKSNKLIGYKVMKVEDGMLVSGVNSRLKIKPKLGTIIKFPKPGIFFSLSKEYVLTYYSGLADKEALLTLEFDPNQISFGNITDRETEIASKEVKLLNVEMLPEVLTESAKNRKSHLSVLKGNRIPLTDEEREKVMKAGAVWHHGPNGEKSPGVWKSKNPNTGEIRYVCATHRAYQDEKTLDAAIKSFEFIKETA
jgi:hypothetical protein